MENLNIPWSDRRVVRALERGGFGRVYEIERDIYGAKEKAAMKVISIPKAPGELEVDYSDGYGDASVRRKYES